MHHPTDRTTHTTAFVTPVVEREIAQWVHPMKDRSDDPSHHKRTLLPWSYVPLPHLRFLFSFQANCTDTAFSTVAPAPTSAPCARRRSRACSTCASTRTCTWATSRTRATSARRPSTTWPRCTGTSSSTSSSSSSSRRRAAKCTPSTSAKWSSSTTTLPATTSCRAS